jgi:hypothetical protein
VVGVFVVAMSALVFSDSVAFSLLGQCQRRIQQTLQGVVA